MNFLNEAQAYEGEMRAFFEDLHRHPEPSHFENRTNRRVREQLKAHGIDMLCPKNNITIAVIHGAKPGKTILLRADMDALFMDECSGLPFCSKKKGHEPRLWPRYAHSDAAGGGQDPVRAP